MFVFLCSFFNRIILGNFNGCLRLPRIILPSGNSRLLHSIWLSNIMDPCSLSFNRLIYASIKDLSDARLSEGKERSVSLCCFVALIDFLLLGIYVFKFFISFLLYSFYFPLHFFLSPLLLLFVITTTNLPRQQQQQLFTSTEGLLLSKPHLCAVIFFCFFLKTCQWAVGRVEMESIVLSHFVLL